LQDAFLAYRRGKLLKGLFIEEFAGLIWIREYKIKLNVKETAFLVAAQVSWMVFQPLLRGRQLRLLPG
jgi:hypothetical protein